MKTKRKIITVYANEISDVNEATWIKYHDLRTLN